MKRFPELASIQSKVILIGWWALVPTVAVFMLLWGRSVYRAIELRVDMSHGQPPIAQPVTTPFVIWRILCAIVLVIAYMNLRDPCSVRRFPWTQEASIVGRETCLYLLITTIGFSLGNMLANTGLLTSVPIFGEAIGYPVEVPSIPEALAGMLAGPLEELALVGIPLLLFGRRKGLAWFCLILVLLRLSFHVYYGLSTVIGLAFWAVMALCMFMSTMRILPLVLGHAVHNLLSWLILFSDHTGVLSSTLFVGVKAVLLIIGGVAGVIWFFAPDVRQSGSNTDLSETSS